MNNIDIFKALKDEETKIAIDIKEKDKLVGNGISVCTKFYKPLAIGNESKNQWIDLKDVESVIEGDIYNI